MRNLIIIFSILFFSQTKAENNLNFYTLKALDNNLQLNAERKNLEAAKQSKNISRSEFYPSLTISGNQTSTTTTNRINQSGSILADTNLDSETKSIELEQVIFSGFKGINIFKKSELETQKAKLELKNVEQKTISDTAKAYFDLIYSFKNEKFNLSNVNLFERQVEADNARLQKGEITLSDLAQSESYLAGANADLIKAKTKYFSSKTNFERITGVKAPNPEHLDQKIILNLPSNLKSSLDLANLNNIRLLISKLDYEISIKDLNIERSRLSPSASINVSKTESKDFSSSIDEKDDESVKATITWPIIKGGENIAPREIDEALLEHDAVLEAAAFARDCKDYGQRVEACVRLKDGKTISEATLRDFCKERIGTYKTPDHIYFLPDLPKGPSGKVQRLKLLDLVS